MRPCKHCLPCAIFPQQRFFLDFNKALETCSNICKSVSAVKMSRQNIQRIPSPRAPLDLYTEFFLISWFLVIDKMLKYLVAEYFVFGRSALPMNSLMIYWLKFFYDHISIHCAFLAIMHDLRTLIYVFLHIHKY